MVNSFIDITLIYKQCWLCHTLVQHAKNIESDGGGLSVGYAVPKSEKNIIHTVDVSLIT